MYNRIPIPIEADPTATRRLNETMRLAMASDAELVGARARYSTGNAWEVDGDDRRGEAPRRSDAAISPEARMAQLDALEAMERDVLRQRIDLTRTKHASLDEFASDGEAEQRRLDEIEERLRAVASRMLADILAAKVRVRTGRFGRCIECDAAIRQDRLLFHPTASRCLGCQQVLERRVNPPRSRVRTSTKLAAKPAEDELTA
jgi:RNA polymerase-binding transcription factor DksA